MSTTDAKRTDTGERNIYEPFADAFTQIRLLTLERHDDRDLQCTLATFDQQAAPPYIAISYVWSTDCNQCDILINGKAFKVRANCITSLEQFLRLVHASASRNPDGDPIGGCQYLWIDSICINQADVNERTAQVGKMSTIYREAKAVLASLGEAGEDTGFAMEYTNALRYNHDPAWESTVSTDLYSFGHLCASQDVDLDDEPELPGKWRFPHGPLSTKPWPWMLTEQEEDRLRSGLVELGSREYWQRLWIIPEIISAKKTNFVCGDHTTSMRRLDFMLSDCMGLL